MKDKKTEEGRGGKKEGGEGGEEVPAMSHDTAVLSKVKSGSVRLYLLTLYPKGAWEMS